MPLGYRVVAAAAPRVAAENALECKPSPFEGSIFLDGLDGILRAGGRIAASGRCEWRYQVTVYPDKAQHQAADKGGEEGPQRVGGLAERIP